MSGDFACRAPSGSCAPTSAIDDAATKASLPQEPATVIKAQRSERKLRIVIAARRDASGREHEARIVFVPLPEPSYSEWRAPLSTGQVLRALGHASQNQPLEEPVAPSSNFTPQQLPDLLVIPSQNSPVLSGAKASAAGTPGLSPPPGRVSQSTTDDGEMR
ncbi:hypothetical protein [Erythrobacter sp. SCSIO 43205]|uniref:hypothetical protein n=1 Tax=Erythrobacter sp. SCSIO 43205 TaxID=2779361 RepID=UPI0021081C58|nr:hypothetical protein [Erythrobacter sp. SCSIO 43205]